MGSTEYVVLRNISRRECVLTLTLIGYMASVRLAYYR